MPWDSVVDKVLAIERLPPSAKDIQFKEWKDTISQLNTTIRTQNDLILSLQ